MIVACKLLETDGDPESRIHPLQILFVRMIITYIACVIYLKTRKIEDAPFGPREIR